MRALVTGGAGFIGSNCIHYLSQHHAEDHVVCVDELTYARDLGDLADVNDDPRYRFVQADICDAAAVPEAMEQVDAVVNFAAATHLDRSIQSAGAFVDTDITGLYLLLEAARAPGIERCLHTPTEEVYGSIETGSFSDEDPFSPSSPYAASKAGRELIAPSPRAHLRLSDPHHPGLEHVRSLPVSGEGRPALYHQSH